MFDRSTSLSHRPKGSFDAVTCCGPSPLQSRNRRHAPILVRALGGGLVGGSSFMSLFPFFGDERTSPLPSCFNTASRYTWGDICFAMALVWTFRGCNQVTAGRPGATLS